MSATLYFRAGADIVGGCGCTGVSKSTETRACVCVYMYVKEEVTALASYVKMEVEVWEKKEDVYGKKITLNRWAFMNLNFRSSVR